MKRSSFIISFFFFFLFIAFCHGLSLIARFSSSRHILFNSITRRRDRVFYQLLSTVPKKSQLLPSFNGQEEKCADLKLKTTTRRRGNSLPVLSSNPSRCPLITTHAACTLIVSYPSCWLDHLVSSGRSCDFFPDPPFNSSVQFLPSDAYYTPRRRLACRPPNLNGYTRFITIVCEKMFSQ